MSSSRFDSHVSFDPYEFREWITDRWGESTDLVGERRSYHDCPLAAWLRAKYEGDALVSCDHAAIVGPFINAIEPLPAWAVRFVSRADNREGQLSRRSALNLLTRSMNEMLD